MAPGLVPSTIVDDSVAPQIAQGQCNTFDPATGTFGEVQSLLKENNVAWRVALDWSPNDDTLLYASVSRGYKSGTTPINAANLREAHRRLESGTTVGKLVLAGW